MTRTEKNPKKTVSQDGPARRISPKAQGGTYCLCASTWFQPSFVANGIHYRVVPTP